MKKSSRKTDDSVKAGLELAADTKPKPNKIGSKKKKIHEVTTEKDADDLIHERKDTIGNEDAELDADDVIHQAHINLDAQYDQELDVDDLIHAKTTSHTRYAFY